MEASAPPHDFALIPTDFRNIVLSGTRPAFESCGARRSLETCGRIVRFVDPFLSQGRLIRHFLFGGSRFMRIGYAILTILAPFELSSALRKTRRGRCVFYFYEIHLTEIAQNIFLHYDFLTTDSASHQDRLRSSVPPLQGAQEANPAPSYSIPRLCISYSLPKACQGSDP